MKLLGVFGAVVLLGLGTAAAAAQDGMDWTGFYAGVGIALQRTSTNVTMDHYNADTVLSPDPFPQDVSASSSTIITTFQDVDIDAYVPSLIAGFGKQLDNKVYLGVEGEYDFGAPVDFNALSSIDCTSDLCLSSTNESSLQSLGRLRAIFGVAPDQNYLLFGTAGLVIGKASVGALSIAYVNGTQTDYDDENASDYLIGATFGAGVEFKATQNLRIRLEGAIDTYPTAVQAADVTATSTADDGNGDTATATLNYGGSAVFSDVMVRAAVLWQF